MAKPRQSRRSKSRGRNLARTETQAGINVSRFVEGERGRSPGKLALSAISASAPGLKRQTARNMTLYIELEERHIGGYATRDKRGNVRMVTYFVDPETLRKGGD